MPSLILPLPRGTQTIVTANPEGRQPAVDAGVEYLKGPKSKWPVRTGRSKAAWQRRGSGTSSQVYNPVDYASYVERFNNEPGTRTLRNASGRMRAAALSTGPDSMELRL